MQWKRNIHCEVLIVKRTLEPYSHVILTYEHIAHEKI